MEILHVPTLIAANVILLLVALAVTLVILKWNPDIPGVRYWTTGSFLIAFGFLLLLSRGTFPLLLSVIFANTFIIAAFYAFYLGCRAYRGKTVITAATLTPFLALVILFMAALAYLTYVEESVALRASLVSLVIACICFLLAFEIAGAPFHDPVLISGLSIIVTLNGVFNLIRAAVTLTIPDARPLFAGGGLAKAAFSESFIMIFAFTLGYVLMILDHLLVRLRQQAEIDYLTNVFNNRSFIKLVEKARASAARNDSALSLIAIDLDHLKHVNDTYGHAAGDAALQHLSSVVTANLRPGDTLGRTGGDEFMVLLPDTELSDALDIAERLRLKIEQTAMEFKKERIALTISTGVSGSHRGDKTFDQMARESDIALYEAKRKRNRVVAFRKDHAYVTIIG